MYSASIVWGVGMPAAKVNEEEAARRLSEILLDATDRRKPKRLTRRQAARMWGIHESTFQKWISTPGRIPERNQLILLARGLDMPLPALLDLLGYQDPQPDPETDQALIAKVIEGLTRGDMIDFSRLTTEQKAEVMRLVRFLAGAAESDGPT